MDEFRIYQTDPRNLSDAEYATAHALQEVMRAEKSPDDPPMPYDEMVLSMRNIPAFVEVTVWAVMDDTLTMRPQRRSHIAGATARAHR